MIRALAAAWVLDVRDRAAGLHPVDQALVILSAAMPDAAWAELAALGIGRRDALLFELRERTFGSRMDGYAECPFCSERLEFALSTTDLPRRREMAAADDLVVEIDERSVRFRLPDSHDLAAAARCNDPGVARRLIADRCVARDEGDTVDVALDDEAIEAVSRRMAEVDPCIDITVDLACPACAGRWEMIVDITSYLWSEIREEARRLLRDVDMIARTYGWSEREILALPPARRQSYLEMIG